MKCSGSCGGGGHCGVRILFYVDLWPSVPGGRCLISSNTPRPLLAQGFVHVVASAWGSSSPFLTCLSPSHSSGLSLGVITLEMFSQTSLLISFMLFVTQIAQLFSFSFVLYFWSHPLDGKLSEDRNHASCSPSYPQSPAQDLICI